MSYRSYRNTNKVVLHNEASSDRRMASGGRANTYLKSNQDLKIRDPKVVERTLSVLSGIEEEKQQKAAINPDRAIQRLDPKTGRIWYDSSLVDWNPSHYRLFVGNIGPDVTEELLFKTFIKYPSLSKVKIPKDTRQGKMENRGYAFISFANADDYLHCFKEMNGKYVGLKPIILQRAKTELGKVVSKKEQLGKRKKHKKSKRKGKKVLV